MPRPKRPWFRLYVETVDDWKIKRLTPSQRWLWIAVLAAARVSCVPGYLMVTSQHKFTTKELSSYANLSHQVVKDGLNKFAELGLVEWDDDLGTWHVSNWNDRQFETDDVTLRTSKHRSKEQGGNVPNHDVGTPPETETETETYTEITKRLIEGDFEVVWEVVPKRKTDGRAAVLKAYAARRKAGVTAEELLKAAIGYRDDSERLARPEFTMGAAKFFGPGEHWKNYLHPSHKKYSDSFRAPIGAKQLSDDPNWNPEGFYGGEVIKLPGEA